MITVEHVCKEYSAAQGTVSALQDIYFKVNAGEIFGIIGKSGAGKSTLVRCINLLERPTRGRVIVDNEDVLSLSSAKLRVVRQNMGMIFQHFNLLSSRNVYDNIALPLELTGSNRRQIKAAVMPLLELTGLIDKKTAYPAQLSGGQKQRVAIARALALKPKVLLSDEATSALDPETTLAILQLLKQIRDHLNLTILLITHEMSVIKNCCDRVAILEEGRLIEENEVGEFFAHPRTAIAKNFIASSVLQHLPEVIQQSLLASEQPESYPLLRLWFLQGTATQPVISEVSRQFDLHINIVQANVECVRRTIMGIMLIALQGDSRKTQPAIDYLRQRGVEVEVVGYVPNAIAI